MMDIIDESKQPEDRYLVAWWCTMFIGVLNARPLCYSEDPRLLSFILGMPLLPPPPESYRTSM